VKSTPDQLQLTIVPANEASWEDLRVIFGSTDCYCQRYKIRDSCWWTLSGAERAARLRE
jgi:hypothetical protein